MPSNMFERNDFIQVHIRVEKEVYDKFIAYCKEIGDTPCNNLRRFIFAFGQKPVSYLHLKYNYPVPSLYAYSKETGKLHTKVPNKQYWDFKQIVLRYGDTVATAVRHYLYKCVGMPSAEESDGNVTFDK